MSATTTDPAEKATKARITDEGIERFKARLHVPVPEPPPFNREAHSDTMRHFANAHGDDNPLYCEPDHGSTSRFGEQVGAPFFLMTMGEPVVDSIPDEVRQASKGALVGVHMFHAGSEWYFYEPVRSGDGVRSSRYLTEVEDKTSEFGGGRSVISHINIDYVRKVDGRPMADHRFWFVHTEREKAKKAGKEKKIERASWTPEEIEEIDAAVLAEEPRGAEPRYWEDVEVGDDLGVLHKGPLTVTDNVGMHLGLGPGEYGWGPLRLAVKRRKQARGLYTRDQSGAWDVVQRLHWDSEWARTIGAARTYDYGMMRMMWLGQLATDWMGDDAWLARLRCEFRKFNYVGDLQRITGEVTEKNDDGSVEVALAATNQRGEVTAPGDATVLLPTREGGPPKLPEPREKIRPGFQD
ncbi:MAG: MaoC family dehydratase N-terminal domain-containing protein [Acidimicrobiia bacterium]